MDRAAGIHRDGLVSHYGPLEVGGRAKHRRSAYLPENVFGLCAASQDDFYPTAQLKILRALEDPDVIRTTCECDVRSRYQSRGREFVEAGGEVHPADIPGSGSQSGIQERSRRDGCSSGGVVVSRGQIIFSRG